VLSGGADVLPCNRRKKERKKWGGKKWEMGGPKTQESKTTQRSASKVRDPKKRRCVKKKRM